MMRSKEVLKTREAVEREIYSCSLYKVRRVRPDVGK
jgi:hypothetical protein